VAPGRGGLSRLLESHQEQPTIKILLAKIAMVEKQPMILPAADLGLHRA